MDFRERVEGAYGRAGFKDQSKLARSLSVKPSSISQLLSGRFPGSDLLAKIADLTGVSYEWLRYGDPDKAPDWARLTGDRPRISETNVNYNPNPIPVIGTVVAGDGQLSDRSAYKHEGADNLLIPDTWRAALVEGMSAYPVVYPGQIVLIDLARAVRPDDWTEADRTDLHDNLVLIETDEPPEIGKATSGRRAYLKRFCMDKRSPDGFVLASIDSGRSSPYVPVSHILMIVPVVGVMYQDPRRPREKRWHAKTVVATIQP